MGKLNKETIKHTARDVIIKMVGIACLAYLVTQPVFNNETIWSFILSSKTSSSQDSGFSLPSQVETQFPAQANPLTQELIQTQSETVPSQPSQPEIDPIIAKCTQGGKKELVPQKALLASNPSRIVENGQTIKTNNDPTIIDGIAVVNKGGIIQDASGQTLVVNPELCVVDPETSLVQFRPLETITTIEDNGEQKIAYEWYVPGKLYPEYPLTITKTHREKLLQKGEEIKWKKINGETSSAQAYIHIKNSVTLPDGRTKQGQLILVYYYEKNAQDENAQDENAQYKYIGANLFLRIPKDNPTEGYEDIPASIDTQTNQIYFAYPKPLSFPKNPGR